MDSGSSCACFCPAVGVWLLPERYMVILAGFCPVYALKNRSLYMSVVKLSAAVGVSSSRSSRDTGDCLEGIQEQHRALPRGRESWRAAFTELLILSLD